MALGSFRLRSTSRSRDQVKRHPYTILWARPREAKRTEGRSLPVAWLQRQRSAFSSSRRCPADRQRTRRRGRDAARGNVTMSELMRRLQADYQEALRAREERKVS